jgi:PAS domain S-box-containing protein
VPRSLTDLAGLRVSADDFLAAVLEAAAQPIWVVDPDDVIRFANPAAIAVLGYDGADELVGRRSHETIHHSRPDGTAYPAAECALRLPRTTGETVASERDWFFRRDGSMFPVSFVSAPIEMEHGRGAVVAFTNIEERLRVEGELRDRDAALETQQASLRRVAALVAGGAASAEVFASIAKEVGSLLRLPLVELSRYEADGTTTVIGAWSARPQPFEAGTHWPLDGPTVTTRIKETGRPARVEYAELPGAIAAAARANGIRAGAGAPIIVDGRVWGSMATCVWDEPLPDDIEDRVSEFTALIAAAFSNTASRDELARLADEQAALRRVATLVARGVPPSEVFAAVAREVGLLLGADATHIGRYEVESTASLIASWSRTGDPIPVGTVAPIDGENVCSLVRRSGRPARMNSYDDASGPIAAMLRDRGIRSSVGAPIVVDQRLWGVIIASSEQDAHQLTDAESRIAGFTELVATAISNAEARAEVARLVDEQAALRRVATLVAEGVPADELLGAVTREAGTLLGADLAGMIRYVTDDSVTAVATWAAEGTHPEVRGVWPLEGDRLATAILRQRRPTREDDWHGASGPIAAFVRDELGIRSSVGSPIIVEGLVWGALFVHSKTSRPLPADTESRVANFTELVATAMSNAQARADVTRLADEQAALRRVATLVAHEPPPDEVFGAVAAEVGRLLPVEYTAMLRYEDDGTATVVATWGERAAPLKLDTRMPVGGKNVTTLVQRTGRPARIDDYGEASGAIGTRLRGLGTLSAVGCPIIVNGELWGVTIAAQGIAEPLPAGTEARIAKFTELIATAISNVQARSELAASRARLAAAADEERRRVVRDLHDGAQQRLVHTVVTLTMARDALERRDETAPELVGEALDHAQQATAELRELAHGILPAVLTQGGLRAGVEALAAHMPVPVEVDVPVEDRLPAPVEATAYFVVSESLTNVSKHSRADRAAVRMQLRDASLRIEVRDDGVGGARPEGTGLVGLKDRLGALDGRLRVEDAVGGGTLVAAEIPVEE